MILARVATYFAIAWLALHTSGIFAQDIDWKACEDAIAPIRDKIEAFNAGRTDGLKITLACVRSQNAEEAKKVKPERHIPLAKEEIATLHGLRRVTDAAYEAMSDYENWLIRTHGIRKPEIGDPCYRFVGIKVNDDFITDDPNPVMPWDCK